VKEFLQRDTNGLQEISFNKLTMNNPDFYPFSQSYQWTKHSMIFTHPRCLQCFPTQVNSNQRPSTLKLPPLISQVFLSWSSLSLSSFENELKHLNSTQTLSKLCHVLPNRDTFGAYDPRYDQPYSENLSSKPKIVSHFPKIVSRLDTQKTCSRHAKIVTRYPNRVMISLFLTITNWRHTHHFY